MDIKNLIMFSAREARNHQRRYPHSIIRHVFAAAGLECIWLEAG